MDNLLGNLGNGGFGGPKIDPRDYPSVKCSKCGGILFDQRVVIKKIPGAVVGQAGKTIPAPLEIYVCAKCGTPLAEDVKAYKLEKEFGLDTKEETVNEKPSEEKKQTLIL